MKLIGCKYMSNQSVSQTFFKFFLGSLKFQSELSVCGGQIINALVNGHQCVDGRTAYTVLVSKLPVSKSLGQVFLNGLFFNVHKFTFLCKPISGRDTLPMIASTSYPNCTKPFVACRLFSQVVIFLSAPLSPKQLCQ